MVTFRDRGSRLLQVSASDRVKSGCVALRRGQFPAFFMIETEFHQIAKLKQFPAIVGLIEWLSSCCEVESRDRRAGYHQPENSEHGGKGGKPEGKPEPKQKMVLRWKRQVRLSGG